MLSRHLAAANAQCAMLDWHDALVVFGGPHAYISPEWYATQPAVSTWDYTAVHVTGTLQPMTDPADMGRDLQGLAANDPHQCSAGAMEPGYRTRHVRRHPRLHADAADRAGTMDDEPEPQRAGSRASRGRASGPAEDGWVRTAALIEATLPPP